MKIKVHHEYYCGSTDEIELPCDWSEVTGWWIKWGTFYFIRKGQEDAEKIPLPDLDPCTDIDQKRPCAAAVINAETGEELDGE